MRKLKRGDKVCHTKQIVVSLRREGEDYAHKACRGICIITYYHPENSYCELESIDNSYFGTESKKALVRVEL